MKKKFLLMLPCIVAVAIAVGKKSFESNAFEGNGLFLQNVEALSDSEIGGGKGCSTSITYVNYTISCPECGGKTGRVGVEYRCESKGNDPFCQEGFRGTDTSCTPYHGYTRNVDNVIRVDC